MIEKSSFLCKSSLISGLISEMGGVTMMLQLITLVLWIAAVKVRRKRRRGLGGDGKGLLGSIVTASRGGHPPEFQSGGEELLEDGWSWMVEIGIICQILLSETGESRIVLEQQVVTPTDLSPSERGWT